MIPTSDGRDWGRTIATAILIQIPALATPGGGKSPVALKGQ